MAKYLQFRLDNHKLVLATSLQEARNRWPGQNPQPVNEPAAAPFAHVQGPAPVWPPVHIAGPELHTTIPMSSGDQAGTDGGVISGAAVHGCGPMGNARVVFPPPHGAPQPVWPAHGNPPAGAAMAPSQTKVFVGS